MPYFNKQRGSWMAQVVVDGRKLRSQHPTKAAAVQWEVDCKRELEKAPPPSNALTLREFSALYLVHAEKFAYKTRHEKQLAFRLLMESVSPDTPVSELRKGDILAHFAAQSRTRSGNAANKDRKNLITAWSWAVEHLPDFPARNPFLTARFPEDRRPRKIAVPGRFQLSRSSGLFTAPPNPIRIE